MTSVNLAEPIENALTFFRQQFRAHRIHLREEISEKIPLVKTNRQRLEQIAINFFSNARHAVEKKMEKMADFTGEITVRLHKKLLSSERLKKLQVSQTLSSASEVILFEVADNGIGMDEEVRKRCLEPFFTTREAGDGTGLGLTVSYNLIKSLGWILEIESRANVGSTFRVVIPLEADHDILQELVQ